MASICFVNISLTPNPRTHLPSLFSSRRPLGTLKTRPPTRMSYNNNSSSTATPATERLISAASYSLPFFNSLQYGRYVFAQFPVVGMALEPLLPVVSLYRSVPYASFVAFFGLYLGVVRNTALSRYVRFNAMQAVTLDVLLVLPVLLQRIFLPARPTGVALRLTAWLHSAIFVFSAACFVYGVASSVLGRTPYLPFVADAAGRQI